MKCVTDSFEDRMCLLFGGIPATLDEQYRGIDFWIDGLSVSVKNHRCAWKTWNYSFELKLFADDGRTAPGWFISDESDVLLMSCGDGVSRFFRKQDIKDVLSKAPRRTVRLSEWRVRDNRTQGRTFVDSESILVGVKELNAVSFLFIED